MEVGGAVRSGGRVRRGARSGRLALVLVLAGCTEATMIRSSPPDATVYVDGKFAGVTPLRFVVPRSRFSNHMHYRVEREGYLPDEGVLRTQVRTGRVIGGLFTLGLIWPFRGVTAFVARHDVALEKAPPPTPSPTPEAAPLPAPPPDRPATPASGGPVVDW
jgi:hypothetical protein